MKKLDLKQIGVQELSTVESRDVDGGWLLAVIAAVGSAIAIDMLLNPSDKANTFMEGWNSAPNWEPPQN